MHSLTPEDTERYGSALGADLPANSVLLLFGELGTGKTTFVKGIAQGASGLPSHAVNSPTFTYLNIYPGRLTIYHFDLYRLRDHEDFLALGFDEHLTAGGICCIEWAERLQLLPLDNALHIHFAHCSAQGRLIEVRR